MAHIDYHVVLDALREHRDQCPLCAFVARSEEAWFESMLYSWVGTEGFQDRFLAANGFCTAHAHRFAARNDGVAVAMLYLPLLAHRRHWLKRSAASPVLRLIRRIRSIRDNSPAGRGERAAPQACLLCDQRALWETQFLRNLARHGGDEQLREAFAAGRQLCLPHYRLMIREIRRIPAWLHQEQEKRMAALVEAVEEYARGGAGGAGGRASTVWRDLLEFMEGAHGTMTKKG